MRTVLARLTVSLLCLAAGSIGSTGCRGHQSPDSAMTARVRTSCVDALLTWRPSIQGPEHVVVHDVVDRCCGRYRLVGRFSDDGATRSFSCDAALDGAELTVGGITVIDS